MTLKLPKATLLLWQLRLGVILLIFDILVAAFSVFTFWMLFPVALFIALEAVYVFVYLPKYFASYKIVVKNESIIVSYGVLIQTTKIMPYARLVYIGSYATVLCKRLRLTGLSLRAARSVLFLPELDNSSVTTIMAAVSGQKMDGVL